MFVNGENAETAGVFYLDTISPLIISQSIFFVRINKKNYSIFFKIWKNNGIYSHSDSPFLGNSPCILSVGSTNMQIKFKTF